jgi:hypothetical protein
MPMLFSPTIGAAPMVSVGALPGLLVDEQH